MIYPWRTALETDSVQILPVLSVGHIDPCLAWVRFDTNLRELSYFWQARESYPCWLVSNSMIADQITDSSFAEPISVSPRLCGKGLARQYLSVLSHSWNASPCVGTLRGKMSTSYSEVSRLMNILSWQILWWHFVSDDYMHPCSMIYNTCVVFLIG